MVQGYVSGTDITFSPPAIFNDNNVSEISATYDSSSNKAVVAYAGEYGPAQTDNRAKAISPISENFTTNLTEENYVGIAAEDISDTETGKVTIYCGVNGSQTGLTAAQKYYINPINGNLESSIPNIVDYNPNLPTIVAGLSISSNEIIVKAPLPPDPDLAGFGGMWRVDLQYVQYDLDTDRISRITGERYNDVANYSVGSTNAGGPSLFVFDVDFAGNEEVNLSKIRIEDRGVFPWYRERYATGLQEYYRQIDAYFNDVLIGQTDQVLRSVTSEPSGGSFNNDISETTYQWRILQSASFRFRDMFGLGQGIYTVNFKRPCNFAENGSSSCGTGDDVSVGILNPGEQTDVDNCTISVGGLFWTVDCSLGKTLVPSIPGLQGFEDYF